MSGIESALIYNRDRDVYDIYLREPSVFGDGLAIRARLTCFVSNYLRHSDTQRVHPHSTN